MVVVVVAAVGFALEPDKTWDCLLDEEEPSPLLKTVFALERNFPKPFFSLLSAGVEPPTCAEELMVAVEGDDRRFGGMKAS